MIKARTFIAEVSDVEKYESMGMKPPEGEEREVDFYFHKEEVYTMLNLKANRYYTVFNDGSEYVIKLTKEQITEVCG